MNKRAFVTLCVAIFVAMLGMGIISPLMALYADSMGANGIWLGLMYSGFSLARALMQPITGWFSDKKGRKTIMVAGLAAYTLVSIGYAIAINMYQLTVVRLLHGIASALVIPVAQAYVGDIIPKGKEGTYMGIFSMSMYLGMAAGPMLGGTVSDLYSMNTAFYIMAALAGCGLLLLVIFVPAIAPHERINKGKAAPMLAMLKDNKIKAISLYLGARGILRQSISAFLPLYAVKTMGLSTVEAAVLVTIYLLTEALSQLFMGPIADRFNRKALMITGAIFASALGFFLNHMGNSFTMLLVLVPIAIMATVGRIPALAYNVELGVKYGRMGSSMGITNAAQDLGHFIGPLITGWAIDAYGLSTIFYTGSIAGMLALPLMSYWLFTREIGYTPEVAAEASPADPPK